MLIATLHVVKRLEDEAFVEGSLPPLSRCRVGLLPLLLLLLLPLLRLLLLGLPLQLLTVVC